MNNNDQPSTENIHMSNPNPKILDNVRLIQKCIIVGESGKILALRRNDADKSRGGAWDLPGGGYERGEDTAESIRREVEEESGLTIQDQIPVYFASKIGVKLGLFAGDTVFVVCYACKAWEGEVTLSDEHVEYQWIDPKDFQKLYFAQDEGFFSEAMQSFIDLPSS